MAPPTPVYDRFEIHSRYADILANPDKYQCQKKSLSQNECTFRITYPNKVPQVICLPFKREFLRCLFPTTEIQNGTKVKVNKWTNIEITDENTNKELFTNPQYEDQVKDFLRADEDLKKLLTESQ